MTYEEVSPAVLARQLHGKSKGPGSWQARCPAHEDRVASLSIGEGDDGRLLLHCHAGCEFETIMKAAGVDPAKPNGAGALPKPRIAATYDYHDAAGTLVFQVVRLQPKDFRQRRPDGSGGWHWNMKGIEVMPYNLPKVVNASEVFIVEGEKDCDALAKLGLVASTNVAGAGKWSKALSGWFEGRHVTILPDNDDAGRKHALDVAAKLHASAASIRVVSLPGLPEKGDVSDWLATGGTKEVLLEMVAAAPYWEKALPTDDAFSEAPVAATEAFAYTLLRDLKPKLDRREIIKGCIPAGGFGCAYAEPSVGKTAIIVDMLMHVAAGMEYRGRRVEQQPVIYIALEGHGGIGNRILAAAAEIGISDVPFALITASDNFRDPKASRKAAAVAKVLGGEPVIVIDTMTAALAGGSDCDPADVGALIEAVKAELMMQGCTILIIHHSGKDASRGARGWSGLLAACDFEFELSRDEDLRTLRVSKLRDGSDNQPAFCYQLRGHELGIDRYGEPVTAVVVEHLADESEDARTKKKVSPKAKAAQNVLWTMIKDSSQSFPMPGDLRLRVVLMADWEKACVEPGAICNCQNERDRKIRFKAAQNELVAAGLVVVDDQRVFPAQKDDVR